MINLSSKMPKKEERSNSNIHRKMSNVNWNHVYAFSMVATHGSLKNASEVLGVVSSTLSEQISNLESALDLQLFHRRGPKLILSDSGTRLFWHAKNMFESGQRILDSVSPIKLGCYPVSVGVVPGPNVHIAHKTICDYSEKYGPLDLNINQYSLDEMELQLHRGRIDFGFSDQAPERKDLRFECISSSVIRFFVSSKWQDQKLAIVLREVPLLVCRSEASTHTFIEQALEQSEIYPSAVVRAEYPSVLLEMCRNGLGVGAFCEEATARTVAGSVHPLKVPRDAPVVESKTYLIWSSEAENTQAISFIKTLLSI